MPVESPVTNPSAESTTDIASANSDEERPDHEAIARRAYEIYCQWGMENGHEVAHWLEAERQLIAERNAGKRD